MTKRWQLALAVVALSAAALPPAQAKTEEGIHVDFEHKDRDKFYWMNCNPNTEDSVEHKRNRLIVHEGIVLAEGVEIEMVKGTRGPKFAECLANFSPPEVRRSRKGRFIVNGGIHYKKGKMLVVDGDMVRLIAANGEIVNGVIFGGDIYTEGQSPKDSETGEKIVVHFDENGKYALVLPSQAPPQQPEAQEKTSRAAAGGNQAGLKNQDIECRPYEDLYGHRLYVPEDSPLPPGSVEEKNGKVIVHDGILMAESVDIRMRRGERDPRSAEYLAGFPPPCVRLTDKGSYLVSGWFHYKDGEMIVVDGDMVLVASGDDYNYAVFFDGRMYSEGDTVKDATTGHTVTVHFENQGRYTPIQPQGAARQPEITNLMPLTSEAPPPQQEGSDPLHRALVGVQEAWIETGPGEPVVVLRGGTTVIVVEENGDKIKFRCGGREYWIKRALLCTKKEWEIRQAKGHVPNGVAVIRRTAQGYTMTLNGWGTIRDGKPSIEVGAGIWFDRDASAHPAPLTIFGCSVTPNSDFLFLREATTLSPLPIWPNDRAEP